MSYVPNQNGKVLKETLVGFNSQCCENDINMSKLFKNDPSSFANSSTISLHFSVPLLHTIESITNDSAR